MVLSQDRQLGYDRLLAWLRAGGVLADGILGLAGEGGAVDDLDDLLREIDRLKGWLDAFRPLPGDVVAELKQRWDVRFTYNSNAIGDEREHVLLAERPGSGKSTALRQSENFCYLRDSFLMWRLTLAP
jgi:hypothetical protein